MKKNISLYKFSVYSFLFTCILGTFLHFTFELSDKNNFVALFSAVNESTWEHLKLLFFPMLFSTIIGFFYFREKYSNFLCAKIKSICFSLFFTISFFYTYTGIIGNNFSIIDILSFYVSCFIGEYVFSYIIKKYPKCNKLFSIIILIILIIMFFSFTFNPPKINLFKDPVNNSYGIVKN